MKALLVLIGIEDKTAVVIYEDNQAAQKIAENQYYMIARSTLTSDITLYVNWFKAYKSQSYTLKPNK
jgi:hypothetical protein